MEGFQSFDHRADVDVGGRPMTIEHPVFHAGRGPALILMHELPGLDEHCIRFAERLVKNGFEVFMPLLAGRTLGGHTVRNTLRLRLCIAAEFGKLRAGETAPIACWLRTLARRIGEERATARIGAIGMCLTGAFVVPLLLEANVHAVVASQPGVPFNLLHLLFGGSWGLGPWQHRLNVSDDDIEAAAKLARAEGKSLLVQRFDEDRICPRARTDRLAAAFGPDAMDFNEPRPPGRGFSLTPLHSLLTGEYDRAERRIRQGRTVGNEPEPTHVALRRLVEFFETNLKP